jgi:Putative DNA-binding domain
MLKEDTLISLINLPESRTLEKKRSCPNAAELRKSLVALANSVHDDEYAVLLLGVSDSGDVIGLEGLDSIQKTILQVATTDCYPPIGIVEQSFRVEGRDLLAVVVRDTLQKPYFTGKSYHRVGSVSKEATGVAFEELISQRNDKTRRILAAKGRNVSMSFDRGDSSVAGIYGNSSQVPNRRDYWIYHCDNWIVKILDATCEKKMAYAVSDIKLDWDIQHDRLRLMVPFRYPREPS